MKALQLLHKIANVRAFLLRNGKSKKCSQTIELYLFQLDCFLAKNPTEIQAFVWCRAHEAKIMQLIPGNNSGTKYKLILQTMKKNVFIIGPTQDLDRATLHNFETATSLMEEAGFLVTSPLTLFAATDTNMNSIEGKRIRLKALLDCDAYCVLRNFETESQSKLESQMGQLMQLKNCTDMLIEMSNRQFHENR